MDELKKKKKVHKNKWIKLNILCSGKYVVRQIQQVKFVHYKCIFRASLVAQWLRVCLPMQGTQVHARVREDPTCRGANYAREPQLLSLRVWSLCSAARAAMIMRGLCPVMKSGPHLPQLEKALARKRRPNTAINKLINLKK